MVSRPDSTPVIIAVAPNGARHNKGAHPGLPISPEELAKTAATCSVAGASMIHLHVRDAQGGHSLRPEDYRPALRAIRAIPGPRMLLQVTSEAAGVYSAAQQMRHMTALAPDCMSLAVREFFEDPARFDDVAEFLQSLHAASTLIQYILYDPADVRRFRELVAEGVIPGRRHFVLFVLGRYVTTSAPPARLEDFVAAFGGSGQWMACAFGRRSFGVLREAISLGGHVRIGFENGWHLPDGSIAPDNAALVRAMAGQIHAGKRTVATVDEASALLA